MANSEVDLFGTARGAPTPTAETLVSPPADRTALERDVAAVGRIGSVPSILKVLCQMTGMGFAAAARVTDGSWTACAVQDDIAFGLRPGGQLDVHTTLCKEVRASRAPVAIDQASLDPVYAQHHTPRIYGIESYVSVPIVLPDGGYFGNLCAIDPRPAQVATEKTIATFTHFAQLIAFELDNQARTEAVARELLDEKAGGALREQFIAVLGHDLRNPLSSIAATAQVLKRRPDDAARVLAAADRIAVNTARMTRLIDDLLDFARGRLGGGLQVAFAPIDDLQAAIVEVVDELRAAHPVRALNARVAIDRPVRGDRSRMQQLVSNLVGNAIAHGDAATPIGVVARTVGGRFELTVRNGGAPIPAETLASLFTAFKRRGIPSGRDDGLGLGLYICDQIVKAHGGSLDVVSTAEGGTVFTARLPLD